MKKLSAVIVCITVLFALTITAFADCGPKPSLRVKVTGAEEQEYYLTLVTTGNHVPLAAEVVTEGYEDTRWYKEADPEEQLAFRKIVEYCKANGYNFFGRLWERGEQLSWSYYPPDDFTLLAYFLEADSFAISQECSCYAFSSYFTADLSGWQSRAITINDSHGYAREAGESALRLLFTIAVELIVALIFGYWEKNTLLFFAVVNAVTQVALNVLLTLVNINYGLLLFLIVYFISELLIAIFEALFYGLMMPKYSKHCPGAVRAVLYAITANIASFVLGVIVTVFCQVA